jgi:hypothetical protein
MVYTLNIITAVINNFRYSFVTIKVKAIVKFKLCKACSITL